MPRLYKRSLMIFLKTTEEVELLRESNLIVSKTLAEVGKMIRPGVTTKQLNQRAEEFIRDNGAVPAFLGYGGFPATLCTSVNDVVVHGIPNDLELREGDIISVDCGAIKNDYVGDSAYTFTVGEVDEKVKALVNKTKESLMLGLENAKVGKRVGDIGFVIQKHVEQFGYSVVREMVGHGIGKNLHEKPEVPNYGRKGTGTKLKKGLTICIEPMVNLGRKEIKQDSDGWTIRTIDGKPSAHFELAVAVKSNDEVDVLSTFKYIEKEINIE